MTAAPCSLVLASASPRRRELLERVGLVIAVVPAEVDETPLAGEPPEDYVRRVAAAKASAAARAPGQVVLAADTTVTIDGLILAKAADAAEAAVMLRRLAGRTHRVLTAIAVRGDAGATMELVTTEVDMVAMDDAGIADYVASGEWQGKAGAYAVQGIAAALVSEIRGSITNVIGLPLTQTLAAIAAAGGPAPRFAAGSAA